MFITKLDLILCKMGLAYTFSGNVKPLFRHIRDGKETYISMIVSEFKKI